MLHLLPFNEEVVVFCHSFLLFSNFALDIGPLIFAVTEDTVGRNKRLEKILSTIVFDVNSDYNSKVNT